MEDGWGFINTEGQLVIPYQYKEVYDFCEGLAPVKNSDKMWGYINKVGNVAIPCQYKEAFCFSEGLAPVKNTDKQWGYINTVGQEVIPCQNSGAVSVQGTAPFIRCRNAQKETAHACSLRY